MTKMQFHDQSKEEVGVVLPADMDKWFSAAANWGDTSACQLLIAAAENGNHLAEACLGNLYEKGCNGLTNDTDKALVYTQRSLPWLRAEVEKSNKYAQFLLAFCYFDGRGFVQDEIEAVRLLRLSANQGHAGAQCKLGLCFENGTGVPADEVEAARLYKLAADQGYDYAQLNLGSCFDYGRGVSKNETEALRLYRLAADQGLAAAQYNQSVCRAKGIGVTEDLAEPAVPPNTCEAKRPYPLATAGQSDERANKNIRSSSAAESLILVIFLLILIVFCIFCSLGESDQSL